MAYLKSFPFTYLDMAFMKKQIGFKPLFDASGKPIINWDGTGAIYDAKGSQLYSGIGLSAADAIAQFGISYPTYTSSAGLRDVDGLNNNLFNATWGNSDLPFMQRTQVIFDNYIKPLGDADPNAFYALQFATSPDPATADYTKIGDNLATPGVDETHAVQNVVDYTPRMISRTVTTGGVTFETVSAGTLAPLQAKVDEANAFEAAWQTWNAAYADAAIAASVRDDAQGVLNAEKIDLANALLDSNAANDDPAFAEYNAAVAAFTAANAVASAKTALAAGLRTALESTFTGLDYVAVTTQEQAHQLVVAAAGALAEAVDLASPALSKDANGYTVVTDYGLLQDLGQQDGQAALEVNGDIGSGGFVAHDTNGATSDNQEYFIGGTNPGVAPVNGWFALFGQFFDHGLDFVGKGADGTKITINLSPDDPMYGVIDPTTGQPATKIVISRADVSGFTADGTPQWVNHTSPYIDQSQTYGSHEQLTNLLREWVPTDPDNTGGSYRMGAGMFDGQTSAEWTDGFGNLTNRTLPTLNELRAHLVATGRDDLSWEDVSNLRNRDAEGHVIDSDANTAGVQGTGSGAALLLDMSPKFDLAHIDSAAVNSAVKAALGLTTSGNDPVVLHFDGPNSTLSSIDITEGQVTTNYTLAPAGPTSMSLVDMSFSIINSNSAAAVAAANEILLESVGNHYIAGDGRANENIGLTAVHHVFHEEHNYQVENIKQSIVKLDAREAALDQTNTYSHALLHEWQVNTGTTDAAGNFIYGNEDIAWNDDMIFNAAKMTVEMEYQHTAVDQFARTITPNLHEFVGYNSGENATISLDFAQVAYRFGHSTLRESIDLMDPEGSITGSIMRVALERAFLSPEKFAAVGAGAIALGMTHQQANEVDEFLTPALNQGLLGLPLDLATINIARGRDLGVPTLNDMREALQLSRYTSWADFGANMLHPESLVNFIAAYAFDGNVARAQAILGLADDSIIEGSTEAMGYTVQQAIDFLNNTDPVLYGCDTFNQIDCWIGGLAEVHVTGGLLGETFDTIFVDQIGRVMDGDRFYYLQRLNNVPYGQQIVDEQFKDIIERTTGVEHLNGSAFAYADQYYDLAGQEVDDAATEHKYGDALAALSALGIYSDGGTTTGLNGGVVTVGGVQYIRDVRTPSADTKAGNPEGFGLDGAPNSGADSNEVLVGTDRNDLIFMRGGDDTAYGEDGDDIINGGNGIDRLYGGAGADTIFGGDGGDLIDGGDGDDVLWGEQNATAAAGLDQLIGSAGNDYIDGAIGIDKLSGSEGDDVIFGGGDTDAFTHGGEGNDYIDGGVTGDLLWGDNGDDVIVGQADQDIVAGMEGDDILRPGPLSQSLTGGGDEVIGGDGRSDAGNDGKGVGFDLIDLSDWQAAPKGATIDFATQGNPLVAIDGAPQFPAWAQIEGAIGSRNDDAFLADANNNWLIGGSGNDAMTGGGGNDLVIGDGIRLDTLIGTYDSGYNLYFDGASNRAFGYTDAAETTGLDRNFIQTNGLLDVMGWGGDKHFTELLKSAMFKNYELGGSTVTDLWRNGVAQTTGESHGTMGDGGTAGTLDTAVFTGNFADYTIEAKYFDLFTRDLVTSAGQNTIQVLKVTDTVTGRDGQDLIVGVEQLKFADRTVTFGKPEVDLHAFNANNYRDQFGSNSYNNSNGSALWTTSWSETGDRTNGNVVTGGEIRVNSNALEFRQDTGGGSTPAGASITRGVDLSMVGSGTALLSFSYNEQSLDVGETLQVQFAADGVNFTTLQTLDSSSNNGNANLPLTGPFTAGAAIRFVFSGVNNSNERVRIDNVDISYKTVSNDGSNDWTATFTEDGPAVGVTALSGIINAETLNSAKVVLTNAQAGDSLSANVLPPGITASTTNVAGVITLTLTGAASASAYQQALDAVRFSNSSQAPSSVDRHIEVTVNNGVTNSDPAISTIHVVSVDDPMVANNDSVVTNFANNTQFNVNVSDLLANDTDADGVTQISTVTTNNFSSLIATLGSTTIAVTDTGNFAGGNFTYQGTSSDTARVDVTRDTNGNLDGSGGADIIIGNASASTIDGNGGRDVIYGGGDNDTFDYNDTSDVVTVGAVTGANVGQLETIMDFAVGDKIDLGTIDARLGNGDTFTLLGESSAAFTTGPGGNSNGGLHYFFVTDGHGQEFTVIEASNDSDANAEFQLALKGHVTLDNSNIIL